MVTIPARVRLRQKDPKFKASMNDKVSSCLQNEGQERGARTGKRDDSEKEGGIE